MDDTVKQQFQAATRRAEARMDGPRAQRAHYDAGRNRVIVTLTTGVEIGFPPAAAEGFETATAQDLAVIEVQAFGLGIHVPAIDADLYVPALLEGILGSQRWVEAKAAGNATVHSRPSRGPSRSKRAAAG